MKQTMNNAMLSTLDDILASTGLARRSSGMIPAIGSFAAGAVFGAVAALLLAPSTGDDLVAKLSSRIRTLRDAVNGLTTGQRDNEPPKKGDRSRANNHGKQASAHS